MNSVTTTIRHNSPVVGIAFILAGVAAISVNDVLIKALSGNYPLHELVFTRSAIGLLVSLVIVQFEGGFRILKDGWSSLHVVRGLIIVISNMAFFAALASLELAETTAIFFVAPLLITLLSIPMLGERVGVARMSAVAVGFVGVLVMLRPWPGGVSGPGLFILSLPLVAAALYALNQVMTRMLGTRTKASAMSAYVQVIFIFVSLGFYVIAGDGRFAEGSTSPSIIFLLRAWIMPEGTDVWLFILLGINSAVVGYCLAQAYRMADAATVAPFEYVGLPLAVLWGWFLWSEWPDLPSWIGMTLIAGSGLFIFLREKQLRKRLASAQPSRPRF
ncbi:MAG: DMT family transporter [Rhizobiaceae bacterium]